MPDLPCPVCTLQNQSLNRHLKAALRHLSPLALPLEPRLEVKSVLLKVFREKTYIIPKVLSGSA